MVSIRSIKYRCNINPELPNGQNSYEFEDAHRKIKKMLPKLLKSLLADPRSEGIDLDSPQATRLHRELIRSKPFLRRLYAHYYRRFERADRAAPEGIRLEIGSGGGFLGELVDGLVTMDVRRGAQVDMVASALEMPFGDDTVGAVFMLNVLHHLSDAGAFFEEAQRVLTPGGRCVMIEPFVSPLSRVIYTRLHHEPFDPDMENWKLEGRGAMSTANDALPWIVFVRDRLKFEQRFPDLEIVGVEPHTISLYLLSGGLSYRGIAPAALFPFVARAEEMLGPARRLLASMMTVELKKKTMG